MANNKSKAQAQQANNNVGEAVSRTEAYIEKNKKKLVIIAVAIVIVIVGAWALKNYYFQPRQDKALAALSVGEQLFQAGEFETALNGDSNEYEGFDAIIKEFGGTKAANLAQAYAGIAKAQLGQYTEAIPYLQKFKGNDKMIAPSVLAALGNCYAQTEDYAKAAATLVKAAKQADNDVLSGSFLVQAGQLYEQLGNKAEALKMYQTVKDTYYQSTQAADIDKYIERVSK